MKSKNVLSELVLSCYSIKSYSAIVKNGFLKRLLYHILLTVILFALCICIPYGKFVSQTGGVEAIINEYVPEFTVEGDTISVSEPVEILEDDAVIIINTDKYFQLDGETIYSYSDLEYEEYSTAQYSQMVFIDSENLLFYDSEKGIREMSISEITDVTGDFNRQTLVDFCTGVIPVLGIIVGLGVFVGILWNTLVSAIILIFIVNAQHREYSFMQCYTISLYARTPFSLIFAILGALGLIIPFKGFIALICVAIYSAVIVKTIDEMENVNEEIAVIE